MRKGSALSPKCDLQGGVGKVERTKTFLKTTQPKSQREESHAWSCLPCTGEVNLESQRKDDCDSMIGGVIFFFF